VTTFVVTRRETHQHYQLTDRDRLMLEMLDAPGANSPAAMLP